LVLVECPGVKEVAMLSSLPELVVRRCRGVRDHDDLIGLPGVVVELWGGTGSNSPRRHNSSSSAGGRTSSDSLLEAVEDGVAHGKLRAAQSTLSIDSVGSTLSGDSQLSWSLVDAVGGPALMPGSPSHSGKSKTPSPPPSPPRVSVEESDDWVEAAKRAHDADAVARSAAEARAEELAREERLADAEYRIELEDARILRAAEERAAFEEVHVQGREKRRQQALERKQMLQKVEEDAKREVTALVQSKEAKLAERQENAERKRAERKARIADLLAKVKGVETIGVMGC